MRLFLYYLLQNVNRRVKDGYINQTNMKGRTVTLDQLAEQDLQSIIAHIAYLRYKFNRYQQCVNDKKYRDEQISIMKQKRIENKDLVTTFVIDYVMLIVATTPPTVFILSLDEALILCKKYNIDCTKTKCLRSMKAAAAGLGAKIVNCKVSFIETEQKLTIRRKAA